MDFTSSVRTKPIRFGPDDINYEFGKVDHAAAKFEHQEIFPRSIGHLWGDIAFDGWFVYVDSTF